MAFVLRTVSASAEGREIVRTSRIEGDRLTVGRSPECAVRLTDLAVALQHATLERSGGALLVAVEPGLTVELNGRSVSAGAINLAEGGDIRIASHLLRFLPTPAAAEDIAVTIERVTEGEAKLGRSAERLFSLASVLPGKRPLSWLLALVVLAVCIAWPIRTYYERQQRTERFERFQADELWSSGHLSKAHAPLQRNCSACHVRPFESVRDTACATCHTKIHGHADPFRLAVAKPDLTRWGQLQLRVKQAFNLPPGRCIDCHTEHQGPQELPLTPQRFCSDCHAGLAAKLPDTKLGDASDFDRAHPEFQPALIAGWAGERPVVERMSLEKRPQEQSGLKFPHSLHLSPRGGPAQMARRLGLGQSLQCGSCHRPELKGAHFRPVEMESDCASCHSLAFDRDGATIRRLPHGDPVEVIAELRDFHRGRTAARPPNLSPFGRRIPGAVPQAQARIQFSRGAGLPGADAAIRAAFSRGGACYDCHQVEPPPEGSLAFRIHPVAFPSRYIRHGWFDHRPHAAQSCSTCHAAASSRSATDLLLPGIATCRTCHGGERTSKPVASSCAMCHDYHAKEGAPTMIVRRRIGGKSRAMPPAEARR